MKTQNKGPGLAQIVGKMKKRKKERKRNLEQKVMKVKILTRKPLN